MSRIAVVPGSFDPVTLGHVDVIARAAGIFDEVHVLVVHNPDKTALLPLPKRVSLLERSLRDAGLPSTVSVHSWSVGLLVDYCTEVGASVLVKGIRSQVDVAYETPMAIMNRSLAGVETVWLDRRVRVPAPSSADVAPGAALDRNLRQINAPAAWAAGHSGAGTTVAVLDSGIDERHPDLVGKVVAARDFTGSGSAEDVLGTGTHSAALIAGSGAAGTARLLHDAGAIVDGCDLDTPSPYTPPLDAAGISHLRGHDPAHLAGVDRVAISPALRSVPDHPELAAAVAAGIPIVTWQALLGELHPARRLEMVFAFMEGELGVLQVEKKIRSRVKRQMEKTQREYYLNEQLKAIQRELGNEGEEGGDELQELAAKIRKTKLTKEARSRATAELKKLKAMAPMSAEATVARNYLDVLLALPWGKKTRVKKDIAEAQQILDEDHYGLEKVKDRIVEYLAVQQRANKLTGPILCLVGPPGVGKTSLGKSIAKATGQENVQRAGFALLYSRAVLIRRAGDTL